MKDHPNMSYCAFENSTLALRQIMDIMRECDVSSIEELVKSRSSREEEYAVQDLIDAVEELNELFREIDPDRD